VKVAGRPERALRTGRPAHPLMLVEERGRAHVAHFDNGSRLFSATHWADPRSAPGPRVGSWTTRRRGGGGHCTDLTRAEDGPREQGSASLFVACPPCYTKRGIFITSLVYLLDHLVNMDNLCEYKFSSWTVNYPSRQETVISKGFKSDCEDFG